MDMHTNDKSKSEIENSGNGRYANMHYNRCGKSGVLLPAISLGLWHNFGDLDDAQNARNILTTAFDLGIVHFDLANNYGPPYGTAEKKFGTILKKELAAHRDELFISTKAGYDMWPGPYGNWGSRKYLMASIDQSLSRMNLDYVDVFYHHRPDPETPLEETMVALSDIVKHGKALYVALSNYPAKESKKAFALLKKLNTPAILHQARYSLLDRWVENDLLTTIEAHQVGCIAFSPLAQGLLTEKYLHDIPKQSRAAKKNTYLEPHQVNNSLETLRFLHQIAQKREQKLSQMAIAWLLQKPQVTSVLVGASSPEQLKENVLSLEKLDFAPEELIQLNNIDFKT